MPDRPLPPTGLDAITVPEARPIPAAESMARYRRAADYLAAALIHLTDNPLLREPLRSEHLAQRLPDARDSAPVINLVYLHLNRFILRTDRSVLLVTDSGHGAAAHLANMFLEGTLGEHYPQLGRDERGLRELVRGFGRPDAFPRRLTPEYPGVIHEGGAPGHALATAFGAALDNPGLLVACLVGDVEAETDPAAGAWHSPRCLDPARDGAVLPVLHLDGHGSDGRGFLGSMTDAEVSRLFEGQGWTAHVVSAGEDGDVDEDMARAMDRAQREIDKIQLDARAGMDVVRPRWPMIVLRMAGELAGEPLDDPGRPAEIEAWLRGYGPEELFDADGRPAEDILALCPRGERRMASNPHACGGSLRRPLVLPAVETHAVERGERGSRRLSGLQVLKDWLRDVAAHPDNADIVRIVRDAAQGWLQGYLLTGRHGLLACEEASPAGLAGLLDRHAGFLRASLETGWRPPVSSLTVLLPSPAGRGAGSMSALLDGQLPTASVFLPPDAHCLLHAVERCLRSTDSLNLVIASEQPLPQWLSLEEAREHCEVGASVWRWASTDGEEEPDVVLAGCGDQPTQEVLAAADILRREAPSWRVRVVNVANLLCLGVPQDHAGGLDSGRFERLFPIGTPVILNVHGSTAPLKQLLWERPDARRFRVHGGRGEGDAATPFDQQVRRRTSRYHLVIQVAHLLACRHPCRAVRAEELIVRHERKLEEHREHVRRHGVDLAEVSGWSWTRG